MYTIYAIQSYNHNYIYVGQTINLKERLIRHNKGYEKTTKFYRPFILIYTKECISRIEA
ncbi:MAG TPA: GIY-YIG nuclease family protein [Ignavibacteriaceae bacterium]|nr:GIY-YIG nuclease family protein [Ignavibacteriaceae bacterium]